MKSTSINEIHTNWKFTVPFAGQSAFNWTELNWTVKCTKINVVIVVILFAEHTLCDWRNSFTDNIISFERETFCKNCCMRAAHEQRNPFILYKNGVCYFMEFGFFMTCFVYNASALCLIHSTKHTVSNATVSDLYIITMRNISLMMNYMIYWVRCLSYTMFYVLRQFSTFERKTVINSLFDMRLWCFLYKTNKDLTKTKWKERRKLSAKWNACCWLCKFSECGFAYRICVCHFDLATNLIFSIFFPQTSNRKVYFMFSIKQVKTNILSIRQRHCCYSL